jgi:hypothetical protein
MEELPGLHIQSTKSGSPLEKQLSKTGQISRNSIISHISKPETSAADKFTLQKVLDEKFPNQNKIDYNDFRKAVSDELVDLERNIVTNYELTNWGLGPLGYPSAKKSSYELAIKNIKGQIEDLEKYLSGDIKPTSWQTSNEIRSDLKIQLSEAKNKLAKTLAEYKNVPLENISITYSNPIKFGRGSADHFDSATLGHARTLVSKEEPDVMHFLEQQSDYWQKLGKQKPIDLEKYKETLARQEAAYLNDLRVLKKLKETKQDFAGNVKSDWEIQQFEDIVTNKGKLLELRKGDIVNPQQKEFLGKAHQERLLQENVKYAAEQGKSKVRVPTSETAAKIQGYNKQSNIASLLSGQTDISTLPNDLQVLIKDVKNASRDSYDVAYKNLEDYLKNNNLNFYSKEHQTILKKYSEQPKMINKLFRVEPKVVTDSKGNTWYEFDVPESFKQGKAEIKAFKYGGWLDKYNSL